MLLQYTNMEFAMLLRGHLYTKQEAMKSTHSEGLNMCYCYPALQFLLNVNDMKNKICV